MLHKGFRAHFFTSSWDPHFSDFGANLAPFCLPTWPKIGPRAIQNPFQLASYFWSLLSLNFDRFLLDFRPQNRPKIDQQIIPTTQQPKLKNIKKQLLFARFLLLRPGHVVVKSQRRLSQHPSKNSSQINTPTCIDFGADLAPFWKGVGGQDGAKLAPNRSKNRSSNRS